MLSARLDGETILLHDRKWDDQEVFLRTVTRERRVLAPCCGERLILRWGQRKVRHFAHPPKSDCPYDRWVEPESPEHVMGKIRLYEWCRQKFGTQARVLALEYPLPETLQRPDVYLELVDGTRYAFEYQRSVITPGEWTARHEAYQGLGVHDIWVLGDNRLADATPNEEQQARWSAREPAMHFLKLRAFEGAAAGKSPYEVAWWRGDRQEDLWTSLELDARVGREVSPWYKRSSVDRLRSLIFLNANTGELSIFRAMRELPGHIDTKMASVVLRLPLESHGMELIPEGLSTPEDRDRLARHEERVGHLESMMKQAPGVMDSPAASLSVPAPAPQQALPAYMPEYFHALAGSRTRTQWPPDVDATLFLLEEQENEQQRRLQTRAEQAEWRKIVDRYALKPENLHFLIGIPVPDDTIILEHRTIWQAYIYYRLVKDGRGTFTARRIAGLLERRFGFQAEMVRVARYLLPGRVHTPEEVIGLFLNLLVDTGYLRNDMKSEHFLYHAIDNPTPPLAFTDRRQRWQAWAGLLQRRLRRDNCNLVGDVGPIRLTQAVMEDRPTPAQAEAVARLVKRHGLAVDLDTLTFTEASRLLSAAGRSREGSESPSGSFD